MQNRQLIFSLKKPYELVAERGEANPVDLTFPVWWRILEVVRTHFAAYGGEKSLPRKSEIAAPPRRTKTAKEPVKISARTAFYFWEKKILS